MKKKSFDLWIFTNLFLPQPNDVPQWGGGPKKWHWKRFLMILSTFFDDSSFLMKCCSAKRKKRRKKTATIEKRFQRVGGRQGEKLAQNFVSNFMQIAFLSFILFILPPNEKSDEKRKTPICQHSSEYLTILMQKYLTVFTQNY